MATRLTVITLYSSAPCLEFFSCVRTFCPLSGRKRHLLYNVLGSLYNTAWDIETDGLGSAEMSGLSGQAGNFSFFAHIRSCSTGIPCDSNSDGGGAPSVLQRE